MLKTLYENTLERHTNAYVYIYIHVLWQTWQGKMNHSKMYCISYWRSVSFSYCYKLFRMYLGQYHDDSNLQNLKKKTKKLPANHHRILESSDLVGFDILNGFEGQHLCSHNPGSFLEDPRGSALVFAPFFLRKRMDPKSKSNHPKKKLGMVFMHL